MNPYIILSIIIFSLFVFMMLVKKGRYFMRSALLGIFTMTMVNILSFFTSFSIGVNLLTISTALLFGMPGTALMMVLKLL